MLRHNAAHFMHVTTFLSSSVTAYAVARLNGQNVTMKFEAYAEEIDSILPAVEALQLSNSYKSLVRLRAAFEETISGAHTHPLDARFNDFKDRLQDELGETYFLALAPHQVTLWGSDNPPFGDGVAAAFPSASDDLFEAAKCLAVERGTACVMHLMRASEAPLKALAATLSVGTQSDWGSYIREIDKELNLRFKAAGKERRPSRSTQRPAHRLSGLSGRGETHRCTWITVTRWNARKRSTMLLATSWFISPR
jgi:hypothetical protein